MQAAATMMDVLVLKDEISKDLDLPAAAGRDAAAGLPKEDARTLSAVENDAVSAAEQKGWKAIKNILLHYSKADNAIAECHKIVNDTGKAILKRQNITPPDSGNIDLAKRRLQNAETAYIRYKTGKHPHP